MNFAEGNGGPEDIFCLHCGYNLRGLPGDPIQCPECGGRSELRDLRIPATVIARIRRRLETLPLYVLQGCG